MNAMVIGISPDYNFPGSDKWLENDTYFASNYGGSFITRAIMKEFNAKYIDIKEFSNIEYLKENYDTCILALATHANNRDISIFSDLVEKLEMKTIVLSLGISDYSASIKNDYPELHPSLIKILEISTRTSKYIGVRGPYTAHVLNKHGFKNVLPIGCPTMFWNLKPNININVKNKYDNPLIVYQENIAKDGFSLIDNDIKLLGQDFKDEVIFTSNLDDDIKLVNYQNNFYNNLNNKEEVLNLISENGLFPDHFDEWFETIGKSDFVFGPRLHGVICALMQGIPAVLTTRDLRTKEMVEMFKIPFVEHSTLENISVSELINSIDFTDFFNTYIKRYNNYLYFIKQNKLESNLENLDEVSFEYQYTEQMISNYLHSL